MTPEQELPALGLQSTDRSPKRTIKNLNWENQADLAGKWMSGDLAAVDSAGGVFAIRPDDADLFIVDLVILDVTTASSGACTVDVGVAADATTLSDTLIDGVSVAATGLYNNSDDKGTNGRLIRKSSSGYYVTASVASGASTGLVGKFYIRYRTQI